MKKTLVGAVILLLVASAACRAPEKPAPEPAAKAASAPPVIDVAAVLEALQNGDEADVTDALQTLSQDRAGWSSGKFEALYEPLWAMFVKVGGPMAGPANTELRAILHNLFNFGNWYPLLDDFLAVLDSPTESAAIRQEAAVHIWRFASKDEAGGGFSIPPADRPRIEAAVSRLLQEKKDLGLLSTAVTTAARLRMKEAVPRLKAIVAEQAFNNTETRSFRFTLGEALFDLGQTGPAVDIMRKLADDKGDFSEEAADFLRDKHLS